MKFSAWHIAASSLLLLFFVSCAKEHPEPVAPEGLVFRQFGVGFESTRSALSGMSVVWQSGDQLSVFDGNANRKFQTVNDGTSASFCGYASEASNYTLLYPYDQKATLLDETVTTSLNTAQSATMDSFAPGANISIGSIASSEVYVTMKNVCALVSVTLPQCDTVSVKGIRIETLDATPMTGQADISFVEGAPVADADSLLSRNYVDLTSDVVLGEGTYYAAVFPGTATLGLKVTLYLSTGDRMYKEYSQQAVLTRNEILEFATFDYSEFILVKEIPEDPTPDPVSAYASYGVDFSTLKGHPRLFMTDADFAGLKKRVTVNGVPGDYMYDFHQAMLYRTGQVSRKADDHDLEYIIDENNNILDVCDEAMMRLIGLSYGYRLTGEQKYLDQARHDLACVCDPTLFPDWFPSDMMCPSEMAAAVSVAYDWLYDYLTKEERQKIQTALYNNEIVPYSKYKPREDSNWNQSTTGAAVMTAVVLYDQYKTACAAAFDKSIASNARAVKNIFYPYGSGKEGSGYCNYTIAFEGCILQALETCWGTSCGIDEIEGLEANGEWFLYNDGPIGTFNYSDATDEELTARTGNTFLAAHYDRPDFFLREQEVLRRSPGGNRYATGMHAHMTEIWLWKNQFSSGAGSFPTKKVWSCGGDAPLVLARLGWTYGTTDSYVGLKAAGGYSSHSHLDGGSFVFDALGYRWSSDTRMGPYAGYKNDIAALGGGLFNRGQKSYRWDILCQNNYFHSTLAFTWSDGSVDKLHVTDQISEKACSVIDSWETTPDGRCGGKIDITDHYSDAASAVYRSVLLSDAALEVTDEITSLSGHSAPFEWRMVTKAAVTVHDTYVELKQGNVTMYLSCTATGSVSSQPVYAVEQTVVRPSSWTPRDWDSYQSYDGYRVVKFSAEVAAGGLTGTFKTVINTNKPE